MIVFGIVLLVLGWFLGISLLTLCGGILLVLGVVFLILGSTGHQVGGRHWW